ncbi:hypothetical protein PENTCL1PPCAC_14394, partial [Pristionchus entomophagus]
MLCEMRRIGELGTCSTRVFNQIKRGTITLHPATYSDVIPNTRIMHGALFAFSRLVFDDFKTLPTPNQHFIVEQNFEVMTEIDQLYRSVHYFPDNETGMPSYTTYISLNTINELLSGGPAEMNKEGLIIEITKSFKHTYGVTKEH